jgi:hypothetical protein
LHTCISKKSLIAGFRSALLTRDEAQRIAAVLAKLPGVLGEPEQERFQPEPNLMGRDLREQAEIERSSDGTRTVQ